VEDELLKWKFRRNSPEAFSRIYEKYLDSMLTLAMGLVNDAGAAEDIVHDVFVGFARSAEGSGEPLYTGYHLAFTRKQGRFAEWGLYVPDGPPPADVQATGYEMLYRWNLEFAQHFVIDDMTVKPEFTIETAEEFDEWVLGAMAELADNGTAPENLTYQKVIDLAQQIRTSIAP
jgi:hypothetical protein